MTPSEKPEPLAKKTTWIGVATWGGAYQAALKRSVIEPFTARTALDVRLRTLTTTQSLETVLNAVKAAPDVVDIDAASLGNACEGGLVERLSPEDLPDAAGLRADLPEGTLSPCGIPSMAWSLVTIVNEKSLRGSVPRSVIDLFDAGRRGMKRAFPRNPRHLFEMALMSDGVAPGDVYRELSTEAGLLRAISRLDAIKSDIVWTATASEALELIRLGRVAAGVGFSGRAFEIAALAPHITLVWDGQVYDMTYWAIPRAAPHKAEARQFISFAVDTQQLAHQAELFPYGPLRRSAARLVGRHRTLDIPLAPYLPTSDANLTRALRFDAGWWQKNEVRAKAAFETWLAKGNATSSPTTGPGAPGAPNASSSSSPKR